jgi:hypothetical protein
MTEMKNSWYGTDMFTEWKNTAPSSGLKRSGEPEKGQTTMNLELEYNGTNEGARPL